MRIRDIQRKLRQYLETFLAGVGLLLIPCLPRRAILAISRGIGRIGYCLDRRGRKIALENLALAFGSGMNIDNRLELLRQVYCTFALTFLDIFWFSRHTAARLERWVRLDDSAKEYATRAPAVVVTAHFGNWEVGGLAVSRSFHPLTSVAMPLMNPAVDGILNHLRSQTGQQVVAREGALKKLLPCLRGGRNVAILPDQNTLPEEGGLFVNFFGLPVPSSRAAAALAQRTGAAILFLFCRCDSSGRYLCYSLPEQAVSAEEVAASDDVTLTQRIITVIEQEIRRHPAVWLWIYKRWRYIPESASTAGYPFYAKKMK